MTVHPHISSAARSRLAAIGVALLIVATLLTIRIAWHSAPLAGEDSVSRDAQEVPALLDIAQPINAVGEYQWQALFGGAAVVAILLAARRASRHDWLLTAGVIVLVGLLLQVDTALKDIVGSPRPSMAYGVEVHSKAQGFGFPSGHTFGDILVFGAFAYLAPLVLARPVSWMLRAAVVILLVLAGPARVVAGAHWPSDVVGGYLWGFGILALAIVTAQALARWRCVPVPVKVARL